MFRTLGSTEVKEKSLFQCSEYWETPKKRDSFRTLRNTEKKVELLFQCLEYWETMK